MLEIRGLNQFYGGSHTLRGIDLTVPAGTCTALLGRNGVGKTTLLRCVMGLLPARSGRVMFDGKDVTHLTAYQRARLGIGYVPQGREIFPRLTVAENLAVGEAAAGVARPMASREEVEGLFPALGTMQKRRGGDLSGGQQQQLAIARALVARPKLLLLDEPTEGKAAFATSPLRILTPRNHGRAAWAYTSTLGGGLVDGDSVRLRLDVGPGAAAVLASQGQNRVYRSRRGCHSELTAQIGEGGF